MDEAKALLLRVALMCLLVMPCWTLHRELVPLIYYPGFYVNLFFFFFGPIAAGIYAGATVRSWVFAIYACVVAAAVITLAYSVFWLGDLLYFEVLPITSQLFAITFGLLLVGAAPALIAREMHRRQAHSRKD